MQRINRTKMRSQDVSYKTNVDLVLVIDGTGSMQPMLDLVKDKALTLYDDIINSLGEKKRIVKKMRVKVIVFRDIYVDARPFEESLFYSLPDQASEFKAFVTGIKASGGGDEPESGLEALSKAFNSDFEVDYQKNKARQIIMVMTDASAHRLDDPQRAVDPEYNSIMKEGGYKKEAPKNLTELAEEWAGLDPNAKRLVIMAPNAYPWSDLSEWVLVSYSPSQAGTGMSDIAYQEVLRAIQRSV